MSVWTEIVCDVCATTFGAGSNSPSELRRWAKREGWIKRVENGRLNDYCSVECLERHERGQQDEAAENGAEALEAITGETG